MSLPVVKRDGRSFRRIHVAIAVLITTLLVIHMNESRGTFTSPDIQAFLMFDDKSTSHSKERTSSSQQTTVKNQKADYEEHRVAGLNCDAYGGPNRQEAQEMVYWRDIPEDADFKSPLAPQNDQEPRYLTFESDEGGFNNIRMGLETAVTMAIAMGRILVLPPEQNFYLLWDKGNDNKKQQKNSFGFDTFYHISSIEKEHESIQTMAFEEFLEKEAMVGNLRDPSGQISFPPNNRTNWNGMITNFMTTRGGASAKLYPWIRNVTTPINWNYNKCVASIAKTTGNEGLNRMQDALRNILELDQKQFKKVGSVPSWQWRVHSFEGNPTSVDAPIDKRLAEILANRQELCQYDESLQNARVVHLKGEEKTEARMLVHFYAFLFFEDYQQDLWTKRFVRDHMRYQDEIQCAAARIVQEMRRHSREHGDPTGGFDTMHIRRGDFQYKEQKMGAETIYKDNIQDWIAANRTIFIATDEKDSFYFDPIREHYHLYFLKDFLHLIEGVNTNFYGMIDQLVAAKGDRFVGAYFSTFTGFINRIRGYHAQKQKFPGYESGVIDSFFYTAPHMAKKRKLMHKYRAIVPPYWASEFPVGWRDIDHDATPVDSS